jgi:tetratricopeptide (TPR) repeat protein
MSEFDPDTTGQQFLASGLAQTRVATAKQLLLEGQAQKAYRVLQAAEGTLDSQLLFLMAQIELGNPNLQPRALSHLKQVVELSPHHTEAWLTLANYWSVRGQPGKQRRCLEKILGYDPSNHDARHTLDLLRKRD